MRTFTFPLDKDLPAWAQNLLNAYQQESDATIEKWKKNESEGEVEAVLEAISEFLKIPQNTKYDHFCLKNRLPLRIVLNVNPLDSSKADSITFTFNTEEDATAYLTGFR